MKFRYRTTTYTVFFIVLLVVIVFVKMKDQHAAERYVIPLGYRYFLQGNFESKDIDGPSQIVKLSNSYEIDSDPILDLEPNDPFHYIAGVRKVAIIDGRFIVGQYRRGYFFIDMINDIGARLSNAQDLNVELNSHRIASVCLLDPDDLNVSQSPAVQRPWLFHTMKGTFGISDPAWGVIGSALLLLMTMSTAIEISRRNLFKHKWINAVCSILCGAMCGILAAGLLAEPPLIYIALRIVPFLFVICACICSLVQKNEVLSSAD